MPYPISQTPMRKKLFLAALRVSNGNISAACRDSGAAKRTVYSWIEKDKEFRNAVESITKTIYGRSI